jgi:LysR family transcriptional regulator, glycine cleavage system transcriptional activator
MTKNHGMRRFVPSIAALHAFESAATYLNFTRAGEDLGLTQSGVSRQVSNLEHQLGVRLFERLGPRLVLTQTGRSFLQTISKVLDDLEEASIDVVRGSRSVDAMQIGVQDSFASQWLVPRMQRFLSRYENSEFNMVPIHGDEDVADLNIDVAVLRGRGAWVNTHVHHLISEEVTVVASPKLVSRQEKLTLQDHVRYIKIQNAHRPDSWLRWLSAKGLVHEGPISGPRFSQTSMVIEAAVTGIGLAVVPTLMIEEQLESGALHAPFGDPVASGLSYFVVYPERNGHSKSVLDFRDWLIAETRHLR